MKKVQIELIALGVIISLVIGVVIMFREIVYLNDRLEAADNYINRLETDHPDYLDTSAESDEYFEWYNY